MSSTLAIPLHGHSVNIVRKCGPALSDILECKFGCVATIEGVDFEREQSIGQQKSPTVVPERRDEFMLRSGVKVSVWKADLTNCAVDAVVNAANEQLRHCGGLALALSKAGGAQIQRDSENYIRKYGDLKAGDAIVTDAGALPCTKVIHAVGPQLSKSPSPSDVAQAEPKLKKAIFEILNRVKEHGLMTVAIPAISSGLFNYPLQECANVIVATVKKYYDYHSGPCPKEVQLVNNDNPTVMAMERACRQILGSQLPPTYSQVTTRSTRSDTKVSPNFVQWGNVLLTLKMGKIEEEQVDVIVNTIGTDRNLSSGQISKAIVQKAGYKMQQDIRSARNIGYVIPTKPYNLHCKEVYHTCCSASVEAAAQERLFKSITECLHLAEKNGHNSIAFPAIGTGALGFSDKDVALIMSMAVNDFAKTSPRKISVYFVIFPKDSYKLQDFKEQMCSFQRNASHISSSHESERRDAFHDRPAPTPQIRLNSCYDAAMHEAHRWLKDILFASDGSFTICNNFIQHFGEEEFQQLSRLIRKGVSIDVSSDRGRSSILVQGESIVDVAHAGLQIEAMLCKIQKDFVREEENTMMVMAQVLTSKREEVKPPQFVDRKLAFRDVDLQVVKVERVQNTALKTLFDLKKKALQCPDGQKMFQCIPACFFDIISHVGFHAECAPPDDPAYGEGIYFTDSVKRAMEVWKEPNKEYLHFVEAEVLTGSSTKGQIGLTLPPAVGSDPLHLYDSVTGPGISVIFCGYQALPKYIITCRVNRKMTHI